MANEEHLKSVRQGSVLWNAWRKQHPGIIPNLIDANLSAANLSAANLRAANLIDANLIDANLSGADLRAADLRAANLSGVRLSAANLRAANLSSADFSGADLSAANLSSADLSAANLSGADLSGADLSNTRVGWTLFANIDLRQVQGLETLKHGGPSTIGIDTLVRSEGNIPDVFLRGAGVPEPVIAYARSLLAHPIEYYTCFISYSSQDEAFVRRLHADLQSEGIRCWFAPEDMDIGDKIKQRIDESIRVYDKVLLVLSAHAIASTWVAYEVERALLKEPQGTPNVLYPVRLDTAVLDCQADWAKDIRHTRHIGDFTRWKEHDAYQDSFRRLLRALQPKPTAQVHQQP